MRLNILLKSKIHHARVTYADPDYVGSIEVCGDVLRRVGIRNGEFVYVWDVDNGERFTTYAFEGPIGVVGINGAAAHKVEVGHRLIVAAFVYTDEEVTPEIVLLDEKNHIVRDIEPFNPQG